MKKIINYIKEYLAIFTGVLFGLLFWMLDILVDVFMFKEGTIAENLSSPEPMEIYFRVIVGSLFVAFGVHNHFVTKKRKSIEKEADKNLIKTMLKGDDYMLEQVCEWVAYSGPEYLIEQLKKYKKS